MLDRSGSLILQLTTGGDLHYLFVQFGLLAICRIGADSVLFGGSD